MKTYTAQAARDAWRDLLDDAQAGRPALIVRNRRDVAMVLPVPREAPPCPPPAECDAVLAWCPRRRNWFPAYRALHGDWAWVDYPERLSRFWWLPMPPPVGDNEGDKAS